MMHEINKKSKAIEQFSQKCVILQILPFFCLQILPLLGTHQQDLQQKTASTLLRFASLASTL